MQVGGVVLATAVASCIHGSGSKLPVMCPPVFSVTSNVPAKAPPLIELSVTVPLCAWAASASLGWQLLSSAPTSSDADFAGRVPESG